MPDKKFDPTVEFPLNEKVWLQFVYDKPKTGEKDGRAWYKWGVKQYVSKVWEKATLFPTDKLNTLLIGMAVKKNTVYEIVKLAKENPDTKKLFNYFEVVEIKNGKPASQVFSTLNVEVEQKEPPKSETPPTIESPPPEGTDHDPIDIMRSCAFGICDMMSELQNKYPDLQMTDGLSKMIVSAFIAKTK